MRTRAALTAKAIRKELKLAFATRFYVKSENYVGRNAVYVSWKDGPTLEDVRKRTNKYQYGSFNSMTDSYEYDNKRSDILQVMFVEISRAVSNIWKGD